MPATLGLSGLDSSFGGWLNKSRIILTGAVFEMSAVALAEAGRPCISFSGTLNSMAVWVLEGTLTAYRPG